jgi:hypothetical protein
LTAAAGSSECRRQACNIAAFSPAPTLHSTHSHRHSTKVLGSSLWTFHTTSTTAALSQVQCVDHTQLAVTQAIGCYKQHQAIGCSWLTEASQLSGTAKVPGTQQVAAGRSTAMPAPSYASMQQCASIGWDASAGTTPGRRISSMPCVSSSTASSVQPVQMEPGLAATACALSSRAPIASPQCVAEASGVVCHGTL